jgi:hypothetical protein
MNNKALAASSLAVGLLLGFGIAAQTVQPRYVNIPGPTVI